ncbi:hypothetical protein KO527_05160 [Pseudoalteromonas sp. C2R02]|uniref:hypothetical protein n=1 Tax=Pseudoalteromonas sp. C2R02 TaxID=2841565 RepID=UPI001C0800F4|nr:hypothetical protein [Pseudoalteromonas sp. C2R02]MBU2968736.1 hypothetical protein [Pseudoalteromonas sp. C2R02]
MFRLSEEGLKSLTGGKNSSGRYKLKPSSKKKVLSSLSEDITCPHQKSLDALAKKPELLKGNQEHYDQVRIFAYFNRHNKALYERLAAIPNGGHRAKSTAGKLKAEGQKAGYLDIVLDLAHGGHFGLKLELKRQDKKKATISKLQEASIARLSADGYFAVVAYGAEQAIKIINDYVSKDKTKVC